jgi:hypothetical protein
MPINNWCLDKSFGMKNKKNKTIPHPRKKQQQNKNAHTKQQQQHTHKIVDQGLKEHNKLRMKMNISYKDVNKTIFIACVTLSLKRT